MVTIERNTEDLELRLLFQALQELYGIDLSEYRQSYLIRRVKRRMTLDKLETITELTNSVLHNESAGRAFIQDISINVTSMFRFPSFFRFLRDHIFPVLRTYPTIRIWHAGCASGEEVLSLAILLKEAGLYQKATIYATDINDEALRFAQKAIYPSQHIKQWTKNYTKSGGQESFADYYDAKYNQVSFDTSLLDHVTFAHHDLTKDEYYKDLHLILCRNVLIYFNNNLQQKVISQFHTSLRRGGYLGVGDKEHLDKDTNFVQVQRHSKVFKK